MILEYIKFRFTAKKPANAGFDFIKNLFVCKNISYNDKIETLRLELLNNNKKISANTFGAGSRFSTHSKHVRISSVAKNSLMSWQQATIIAKLANAHNATNILELGTSLGISSLYLSVYNPDSKIITIEGNSDFANIAENNFRRLDVKNITLINDNFDNVLENLCKKHIFDFVIFDGNHAYNPTIQYFNICLEYTANDSVFVFDDINWSKEMHRAWNFIKNHTKTILSVDTFWQGFVFLDQSLPKKNIDLLCKNRPQVII